MNLHIKKIGKGNPIVCFHGWGFEHTIWLPLAEELANTYQWYLADLPGFGLSPLMSWKAFKHSLLNQLPSNFTLLGWSLGGLFATRLALEEPNRSNHLINVAASPCFIKKENWPGIEKAVLDNFFANLTQTPKKTLAEFITLQLQNYAYKYESNFLPAPIALQNGLQILAEWDFREALAYFNKPASFLFGRLDSITSAKTMFTMKNSFPQFNYFMFAKAAHIPFLSHQDEFIGVLRGLIP